MGLEPRFGELREMFLLLKWLLSAGVLGSYLVGIVYCVTRHWDAPT